MPTYDYQCERCERVFEIWQRISGPPLAACDKCGGPVHRLLAPASSILKGSGFYVKDYPSEARKKACSIGYAPGGAPDAGRGRPGSRRCGVGPGRPRPRRAFILLPLCPAPMPPKGRSPKPSPTRTGPGYPEKLSGTARYGSLRQPKLGLVAVARTAYVGG